MESTKEILFLNGSCCSSSVERFVVMQFHSNDGHNENNRAMVIHLVFGKRFGFIYLVFTQKK